MRARINQRRRRSASGSQPASLGRADRVAGGRPGPCWESTWGPIPPPREWPNDRQSSNFALSEWIGRTTVETSAPSIKAIPSELTLESKHA
jgi:hypothetical protein